ncbi:MAG TPA: elongation factor P [Anaerolineae bacterium]|nr:elongation factor P [Anaerolineae bacterium]
MIDVNKLHKGITFQLDNEIYKVLDYHHHKPGRGNATIRIKARNLRSGTIIEKTFNSGDRIQDIRLEYRNVKFLYSDGNFFHFMDMETFEQPTISKEVLGENAGYLKEGIEVKLTYHGNEQLDVELPITVDLKVIQADPAVKGDTATGVNKRVITESNRAFNVPAFIQEGDVIRIDTRKGEYVTRVLQ